MSHAYTWNPKTKELAIYGKQLTLREAIDLKLKGHEVVDQHYGNDRERMGRFIDGEGGWQIAWETLRWGELDPEFRANLLLLGVT